MKLIKFLTGKNHDISLLIWDKLYLILAFSIFCTPIFFYLLHTLGISIIYHQFNIYLISVLLLLSISYILKSPKISFYHDILLLFVFLFLLSLVGFSFPVFERVSFIKMLGLYISIASAPLFSVFLLKFYERNGSIDFYLKLIFYSGIIISIINIYFFYLLYFGNYEGIYLYADKLGLGSYFKDLGSFFIRPAGFFFDYHSQYYIPLFSIILLISGTIKLSNSKFFLFLFLLLTSIILSGIKTAYITTAILLIFYFYKKLSFSRIIQGLVFVYVIVIISNFYMDNFIFDLVYSIITHDINIILKHLVEVPIYLFDRYFHVILFGGQVGMEEFIYSEVYLITLIYYIGFFGVFIFFIFPLVYTFIKGKTFLIQSITIIFGLSLGHYYIFKSSFNIIATSLFYFYFFSIIYKNKIKINE